MHQLVLLRHGLSEWNVQNRFTGWRDVDLAASGRVESRIAGQSLLAAGFQFDAAYTSLLKRAIRTLWDVLSELDQMWIPVVRDWRLNERHYGILQGLDKAETAEKYGKDQVLTWRRSFDVAPPPLSGSDDRFPGKDRRYAKIDPARLPRTESLKDTGKRVVEYWNETLSKEIMAGRRLLVVSHGNSLRSLAKHLDQISDREIVQLDIPTGIPLVYEFDAHLNPVCHYYLPESAAPAS